MHGTSGEGTSGEDGAPLRVRAARAVVPGPVRRSYAAKLAVGFLLVVVLIAGIGVASYVQLQAIVEDDAEAALRSTAAVQADSVGEWVAGMRAQTRGFAAADVYATGDRERIRRHLRDARSGASSDVAGLHYVDPASGEVVASTESAYEGEPVSSVAAQWEAPIGAARQSEVGVEMSAGAYERNGRLLLAFAREVRVGDGVLVVVGDVRRDFDQLHRAGPVATTRLLDDRGHDVFAVRQTRPSALADPAAFDRARAGETTTHERATDVLAYAPVAGTDWVVVTAAPKAALYEASETVGRNVALLAASAVAVLGVVGFVLGHGTVRSLGRLRRRAREMEAGDLDVDLATHREDEIGRLFAAFDNMRAALREQIRDAEAAREEAEASRRELARQNERLDQFATTVSHDLRNPLNVAGGHRDMLARELADVEGVDADRHLAKMGDAHDRMAAIIDDVLALAREGATVEETERVDLEALATDAWANVDSADAGLTVAGTRSFDADRSRLLRAFENLFRNAVEHGSTSPRSQARGDAVEHGGPSVSVEVGVADGGFYVADDGPGIPEDEREQVFEYGHTTTEDGTGFGLAIVDTVVSAHGWEVAVTESDEGGARFVVTGLDE